MYRQCIHKKQNILYQQTTMMVRSKHYYIMDYISYCIVLVIAILNLLYLCWYINVFPITQFYNTQSLQIPIFNEKCIESFAYPLLQLSTNEKILTKPHYFNEMFVGPGIDNKYSDYYSTETNSTGTNNSNSSNLLLNSNVAVCYFNHTYIYSFHFPHAMQQLYRCVSWWIHNQNSNFYNNSNNNLLLTATTTNTRQQKKRQQKHQKLVLLYDIKQAKSEFLIGFLTALQDVLNVSIVSIGHTSNSVTNELYKQHYVQWYYTINPMFASTNTNENEDLYMLRQKMIKYYNISTNDPIPFIVNNNSNKGHKMSTTRTTMEDSFETTFVPCESIVTSRKTQEQQQQRTKQQQSKQLTRKLLTMKSLLRQRITNYTPVTTTRSTSTTTNTIQDYLDNNVADTILPQVLPAMPRISNNNQKIIVPILPRISILNRDKTGRRLDRSIVNVYKLQSSIQYVLDTMFEIQPKTETIKNNNNNSKVTIHYMEGLSFLQQVQYFANVDIVVSPHGAQLTGIVFMPPKCSHVIELMLSTWIKEQWFGTLASSCNIHHSYLLVTDNPSQSLNTTLHQWYKMTKTSKLRNYNLCSPTINIVHAIVQAILQWYTCIGIV